MADPATRSPMPLTSNGADDSSCPPTFRCTPFERVAQTAQWARRRLTANTGGPLICCGCSTCTRGALHVPGFTDGRGAAQDRAEDRPRSRRCRRRTEAPRRCTRRLTQSILSTPAMTRSWQKNKYDLLQQNELPPVDALSGGSVTLPAARYNYNSDWTLLAGLSPAGIAASLAALAHFPSSAP